MNGIFPCMPMKKKKLFDKSASVRKVRKDLAVLKQLITSEVCIVSAEMLFSC